MKCSYACEYLCWDDEITSGECWTCWLVPCRPSRLLRTGPAWTWRATGCPRVTWNRLWTPVTSSPPRSSSTFATLPEWCLQGRKNFSPGRAAGHPLAHHGLTHGINQARPYIQTVRAISGARRIGYIRIKSHGWPLEPWFSVWPPLRTVPVVTTNHNSRCCVI